MSTAQAVAPISVVIPCYRCASTIGRAVDSVFAQHLAPSEVILVDDGSDDDTPEALRQLERKYPGLIAVVPLQATGGPASARNAAWALATQPYIAFLDADDSWHPEKLRIQYEYMKTHPDVAVCGHGRMLLHDDAAPGAPARDPAVTRITASGLLFSNAFSTPTVMVKSNIPFRFAEGQRSAEDAFLWQQIALSGLAIVRLESELAYIHKAPYGSSGLSSRLWEMERAELDNFLAHYRAGRIGAGLLFAVVAFSVAKYARRLLLRSTGRNR